LRALPPILIVAIILLLTSCVSNRYLKPAEKKQLLAALEQKINAEIGGNYGNLILKLDLLQLDPASDTKNSASCPVSPIFAAMDTPSVTKESFHAKLQQLEERFEEKRLNNTLRDTLYRMADRKVKKLRNIIRNASIKPQELRTNEVVTASTLNMIFADSRAYQDDVSPDTGEGFVHKDNIQLFYILSYLASISNITDSIPIISPLPNSHITSGFSARKDPITGKISKHEGIDFVGSENARIISSASGEVIAAGNGGKYGNMVIIDHGLGVTTKYAHLRTLFVKAGDHIGIGQIIGIQGSTGRVTGPHLHYELRFNGKPFNPAPFMKLGADCSFSFTDLSI
jgi:murein DD-endopeptidase MepM/ murein hydrolase activator NlpD